MQCHSRFPGLGFARSRVAASQLLDEKTGACPMCQGWKKEQSNWNEDWKSWSWSQDWEDWGSQNWRSKDKQSTYRDWSRQSKQQSEQQSWENSQGSQGSQGRDAQRCSETNLRRKLEAAGLSGLQVTGSPSGLEASGGWAKLDARPGDRQEVLDSLLAALPLRS